MAQIVESQTEILEFLEPLIPKQKPKPRCFEYELRYEAFASKRLKGCEVTINVKTNRPAKQSSLVSVSRNAIRVSDFIPKNQRARKAI
ncbi:MAG: hypothetical protein ACRDF4_09225, partial [Rhabdochlamydiaceae bacterium]